VPEKSDANVRAPLSRWGRCNWSQAHVDGALVVYLAGELDLSTARQLRRRLMAVAESSTAATIVLDLSDVSFIDAHSCGLIVNAWSVAKSHGRRLRVDGLHGIPARIFRLLGLEPILAWRAPETHQGGTIGGRYGGRGQRPAERRSVGGTHAAR
jgi:anti-sigma B factor antagonist